MDFALSNSCQQSPPSCRLVKMGTPEGGDAGLWQESWDHYGALSYNDTHVKYALWGQCPGADREPEHRDYAMTDPDTVPCSFGSTENSTNCDETFLPNLPPNRREPPIPWPPHGLTGQPEGPCVSARFCGKGKTYNFDGTECLDCKELGEPCVTAADCCGSWLSCHESTGVCYRPWHGEGLPEYPPDWVEAIQSVAGSADGPYLDLPVYLTSEAALSEPLQAMVAAGFSLPTESASPPTETISMIKPACAGVTVSMTIMGQPNVAVGFVDTTETTKYPIARCRRVVVGELWRAAGLHGQRHLAGPREWHDDRPALPLAGRLPSRAPLVHSRRDGRHDV